MLIGLFGTAPINAAEELLIRPANVTDPTAPMQATFRPTVTYTYSVDEYVAHAAES